MKNFILSLVATVAFGFASAQDFTADQYWASQPPAVRALRGKDASDAGTGALALSLAQQGYTIDVPIMVFGWDPVVVMKIRKADGITWTPSALQPNIQPYLVAGQTATNPPFVPYDPTIRPPGSIKVTTDPADYKPFDPAPPKPLPATNVVGERLFANVYGTGPGALKDSKTANVVDGQTYANGALSCLAHVSQALMGLSIYFICQ